MFGDKQSGAGNLMAVLLRDGIIQGDQMQLDEVRIRCDVEVVGSIPVMGPARLRKPCLVAEPTTSRSHLRVKELD